MHGASAYQLRTRRRGFGRAQNVPTPDAAGVVAALTQADLAIEDASASIVELFGTPRFRALLDQFPTAIYATDAEGMITYYNRAAAEFAGREPRIGIDRWCITWRLSTPDGLPLAHADCPVAIALAEGRPVRGVEAIALRPDGSTVHFAPFPTPIFDDRGRLAGSVNMLVDITELRRAEREVAFLARHDALSGLPNRVDFDDRLAQILDEAGRTGSSVAVVCLDIDRLSDVNDSFGRAVGDEVLRRVAANLRQRAGEAYIARTGSDEFTAILPIASNGDAVADAITRLHDGVRLPIDIDGRIICIGASVGCAVYPTDGIEATTVVRHADSALRQAKAEARGSLRYFDADLDRRWHERQSLQREMRTAIDLGHFRLHYQPEVKADGTICAFEALVRWPHAVRGMIEPDRFIPMAEASGLIIPLSEWILREACREAASWARPIRVAVNISPVQFQIGDLPALVTSVLAETGLAPERLELEITEGAMIDDFDRAMSILTRLRALGVGIALDDFGTGYSSLSYLRAFPLTKLKIDRAFITDVGLRPKAAPIIRTVVGLGHALGLEVAAEGVETRAQLDFLLGEGCDCVQGYLTGRPMEIAQYAAVVDAIDGVA